MYISGNTWIDGGSDMYIDPKTLKPCKHRWVPKVTLVSDGWTIVPECAKCDLVGRPDYKGVSLRKLVKQLG
jgi:hypothetical protein